MDNIVSFKVSGSELSNYIADIQKKSDALSNSAVKNALDQITKGKEVLKIIDDQIKATTKKNTIEAQASRMQLISGKDDAIKKNNKKFDDIQEGVYNDKSLTESSRNEKLKGVDSDRKSSEANIQNNYKESLNSAREQERLAKLQTNLARENIETLKATAKDNIKAITNGDLKLSDVIGNAKTDDEKLVAKLTEEGIRDAKKAEGKENGTGGGKSFVGSLLAVDNINKMLSSVGQLASSQNGFDMIKPAASMAGRIIGGAIGAAVGFVATEGVGTLVGAGVGSSIGGTIGETSGELFQRSAMAKQDFQRNKGRYSAVTGADEIPASTDTEKFGIGITDFLKMQTDFAIKRGDASSSNKTATDALTADKGYGVDQGTSGALVELQRSAKGENKDLADLIGGVIEKGNGNIFKNGDHTYLNEFLGKFIGLQKELLKNQSTVATGTTMDILSQYNKLGGEFDSRDSRSQGNINAIQNGLSNPQGDNVKALTFGLLRQAMPNASAWEIDRERSKGLGSDVYSNSAFKWLKNQGGDESSKKFNIKGMFTGLSDSAVDRVYDHLGELSTHTTNMKELSKKYPKDFAAKAEANTSEIDKTQAHINNGLLQNKYETIEALSDAFKSAVTQAMSGAVIQVANGKITMKSAQEIAQNEAKKAAASKATSSEHMKNVKDLGIGNNSIHVM